MIYCTRGELANHYTTDTVLLSGEIWVVKQIFLERKHQNYNLFIFHLCTSTQRTKKQYLKNSKDMLEYIESRSLSSCNSIITFDIPILYTTIPLSKLKDRLKELVQQGFIEIQIFCPRKGLILFYQIPLWFSQAWHLNSCVLTFDNDYSCCPWNCVHRLNQWIPGKIGVQRI